MDGTVALTREATTRSASGHCALPYICIELFVEGVEERPRQAARPAVPLIVPLFGAHEGDEAPKVPALHRPGALGGRHLDGEVGLQPGGQGVGAALEIEAHRQAGLARPGSSGAGISSDIVCVILSCSYLAHF